MISYLLLTLHDSLASYMIPVLNNIIFESIISFLQLKVIRSLNPIVVRYLSILQLLAIFIQ